MNEVSGIGLLVAGIAFLGAVGCASGQVATVTPPSSTSTLTQAPVPTPDIQATIAAGIKATTEARPIATSEPTPQPLSTLVTIDRLMDPISLGSDFAKYAEFRPDCEWDQEDYEPWPCANSSAVFPDGAMVSQ